MNKLILVFLLFLFGKGAVAQANQDSLLGVWNDASLADTSRLKAIDRTAYQLTQTNPDSAIHFALLQLEFAIEKGQKKNKADALGNLGRAYNEKGELPESITKYQEAFEIYEELEDKNNCARILDNMGWVKWTVGDYASARGSFQKSLTIAEEIGDKNRVSNCLWGISYSYWQQNQQTKALQYLLLDLEVNREIKDSSGIAQDLHAIGVNYSQQGDSENALKYYLMALEINERMDNKSVLAYNLNTLSKAYFRMGDHEMANEFSNRCLAIAEELGDKRIMATALSSLGNKFEKSGEIDKAMENYKRCLSLSIDLGNRNMECQYLLNIGWLQVDNRNYSVGISYCQKSYDIAQEIGSINKQMDACECLYKANKAVGKGSKALAFHEMMMVLQDSVDHEEAIKELQLMEFEKQMLTDSLLQEEENLKVQMAHQQQVAKKDRTRNMLLGGGLILLLAAFGFYSRWRYVKRSRDTISKEKDRSENLLLNILPALIVEELKEKGEVKARDFDMVSILFTDFKGFTQASEKLSASELVAEINTCFKAFDGIVSEYGIEKIKTIGDAYMAAGGLPVPSDDSVKNTVLAALEMQTFIAKRKATNDAGSKPAFEMRVGIHTGPVVAGIVGVKKFQYDIWGDTVNTASRMESNGAVDKVNISQATYELLKNDSQFAFKSRGKIEAKGKGEIEMYFVSNAK